MQNVLVLCRGCASHVLVTPAVTGHHQKLSSRLISTTVSLQRAKRQQKKYRPKVPEFSIYGDTHRLLRGQCVRGERYGPLVELPDYTFLDGRPTPLTPEQRQLKAERQELAQNVFKQLKHLENIKEFTKEKEEQQKQELKMIENKRLKEKSAS